MAAERDRLVALAEAISDGSAVDWEATEETAADDAQRALVRQLRVLAGVARVHRDDDTLGAEEDPAQWGALTILERVGRGSFGSVYRARDPRLGRDVALKLLDRSASSDTASVLIEEGRLLARLRHPHVITVYGADRIDGTAGIWMEFIEGRTLAQILRDDGPFGPREAASIGIDLCGALAAVHHQGMLHRDVKAQNVMREAGGRIVLMDFGAGQDPSSGMRVRVIGTPSCMAPELLDGSAASMSADLYALGVLLFQILTGTFPVQGSTVDELIAAHSAGERRRLRDVRPDLPAALIGVIERATAPQPDKRFQSAGEMQAALTAAVMGPGAPGKTWGARKGLFVTLSVAVMAALAGLIWGIPDDPPPPAAIGVVRSLAVRPLRNLDADVSQKFFAPGLTDMLLAHLGGVKALRVVALSDDNGDAAAVGRLGVDGVLEGSVHRSAGRVRLSVRVVQAGTGTVLWGKIYEGAEGEAFDLQGRMAVDLARDLHVPLNLADSRSLARRYVVTPEAQERYFRGRYLHDSNIRDNLIQARAEFERAIALEPNYAPALASLAVLYMSLGNQGVLTPNEVRALAPPTADAAAAADPALAEAALAVADVRFRLHWDWNGAEEAYRRAIDLNPSYTKARGQYARFLAAAGRTQDSLREALDAYAIDPLSMDIHAVVGMSLYYAEEFDRAVEHFKSRLGEPSARSLIGLGRAASAAGRHEEAVPALHRALEVSGGDPSVRAELARALAAAGDTNAALAMLRDLEARRANGTEYIAPQDLAYIHIALSQPDRAFELLEAAVAEHASRLLWIGVDPRVSALRGDPRFDRFLQRLGTVRQRQ